MPGIMYERNILRGVKNRFLLDTLFYGPFLLSLTPRRGTYVMTSFSLSIPESNKLAEIGIDGGCDSPSFLGKDLILQPTAINNWR